MADIIRGNRARVLLATAGGAQTMRDVASVSGVALSTAKRHLDVLRRVGLVAIDTGKEGTLRSLVTIETLGDKT